MSNPHYIPRPVFDTLKNVIELYKSVYTSDNQKQIVREWLNHCLKDAKIALPGYAIKDYQLALNFLYSYRGSPDTFRAYRREMERFLQWSWFVRGQSILKLKRDDIEAFIEFCLKPYKRWMALKSVARFKKSDNLRMPNPDWRPFEASISKIDRKDGIKPN